MEKKTIFGSINSKVLYTGIFLGLCYLLQAATPLRLNFDAVDFFRMAVSWDGGHGFYPDEGTARYPIGYPLFLGMLAGSGTLNSFMVVSTNLAFLFFGLFSFWILVRDCGRSEAKTAEISVFATLLSWIVVKHCTLALSDLPFFASSLLTLLFFQRCATSKKTSEFTAWFMLGLGGVFVSILVRHVGFCLIPPLLWLIYIRSTNSLRWRRDLDRFLAFLGLACFGIFYLFMISGLDLLPMPKSVRSVYYYEAILHTGMMRLTDLGCALLNLNPLKIPAGEFVKPGATLLGVIVIGLCIKQLFPSSGRPSAIWVYLASYFCLIFLAPWDDPRYLMPVLPLVLFAVIGSFLEISKKFQTVWCRVVGYSWVGCYAGMGILALGYSTWLTFSGPEFANRFGSSESRKEYLYFYGGKSLEEARENPRAYEMYKILERFDPEFKGALAPSGLQKSSNP